MQWANSAHCSPQELGACLKTELKMSLDSGLLDVKKKKKWKSLLNNEVLFPSSPEVAACHNPNSKHLPHPLTTQHRTTNLKLELQLCRCTQNTGERDNTSDTFSSKDSTIKFEFNNPKDTPKLKRDFKETQRKYSWLRFPVVTLPEAPKLLMDITTGYKKAFP